MIAYLIVTGIVSYKTLAEKNPVFEEKVRSKDYAYIYDVYLRSKPETSQKQFYGYSNAPITVTAVLDPTSEDTIYFIKEIFPLLKQEFIENGEINYYHKNYLTLEDIEEKTDRFKYAAAISCIDIEKQYLSFFEEFQDNSIFEKKYRPTEECLEDKDLFDDAMEIENFGTVTAQRFYIGIKGTDNIVIDGVPTYTRLRRAIRDKQILIGE